MHTQDLPQRIGVIIFKLPVWKKTSFPHLYDFSAYEEVSFFHVFFCILTVPSMNWLLVHLAWKLARDFTQQLAVIL